jgi:hypothetical protein
LGDEGVEDADECLLAFFIELFEGLQAAEQAGVSELGELR